MSSVQEAIYWMSGFSKEQWLLTFSGMLLLDLPRYLFANLILLIWTFFSDLWQGKKAPKGAYLPTVCALIPSLNESATMRQCLETLHGSYPFLQIIVIDDGSTDDTYQIASKFAETHSGVLVLRRPRGGGKSTAQNFALPYVTSEIIVVIDSDSTFGPNAIYHLVQPFRDPNVGGASGAIFVRNPTDSLCTMFQAYEYLTSIVVGRILSAKVGTLSIISGAFGAFRTEILRRGYGMDVGPGEDGDITIRIRKMGYRVVFVPESECYTDAPIKWKSLWKQRLRWDMSLVRIHIRKHNESFDLFNNNFRLTNMLNWYDTMFFSVWCAFSFWIMLVTLLVSLDWDTIRNITVCATLGYIILGFFQALTVAFYSSNLKRDMLPCIVFPLYSLYGGLFLRAARSVACVDELINRSSYRDNFVPNYVQRQAFIWRTKY